MSRRTVMRQPTVLLGLLAAFLIPVIGCHSAFVQATVTNQTGAPIRLFEVDYPNASFGSGELLPGAQFRYRFKVLGTGETKISWTDQAGREHTGQGPALHDGQEGSLQIDVTSKGAVWHPNLHDIR